MSLASNSAISTTVAGSCVPGAVSPAQCQVLQVEETVEAGAFTNGQLFRGVLGDRRCLLVVFWTSSGD